MPLGAETTAQFRDPSVGGFSWHTEKNWSCVQSRSLLTKTAWQWMAVITTVITETTGFVRCLDLCHPVPPSAKVKTVLMIRKPGLCVAYCGPEIKVITLDPRNAFMCSVEPFISAPSFYTLRLEFKPPAQVWNAEYDDSEDFPLPFKDVLLHTWKLSLRILGWALTGI